MYKKSVNLSGSIDVSDAINLDSDNVDYGSITSTTQRWLLGNDLFNSYWYYDDSGTSYYVINDDDLNSGYFSFNNHDISITKDNVIKKLGSDVVYTYYLIWFKPGMLFRSFFWDPYIVKNSPGSIGAGYGEYSAYNLVNNYQILADFGNFEVDEGGYHYMEPTDLLKNYSKITTFQAGTKPQEYQPNGNITTFTPATKPAAQKLPDPKIDKYKPVDHLAINSGFTTNYNFLADAGSSNYDFYDTEKDGVAIDEGD